MLIRGTEIDGIAPLDVRLGGGRIVEIGPHLVPDGRCPVLDAKGGALLPGLHDHHVHLLALAASLRSVPCGPPDVGTPAALASRLHAASVDPERSGDWIRGVGYHESVAGGLDRHALDRLLRDRPLRIQHRSGAMWVLNSAAVERLGLDRGTDARGVERDARGRATGRLLGLDAWLRERLPESPLPDLGAVSRRLARLGVTGATDATVHNGPEALRALAGAVDRGELVQRLVVMGRPDLPLPRRRGVERGAVKVVLDDASLPSFAELERTIKESHRDGRSVALHCVTRASLVLAATVFTSVGSRLGDRIEHASVAPDDVLPLLAALPVTVVTQPHFIFERGDAYLRDVDPEDRPWLYRAGGFLSSGVMLGGGTDAPFGDPDPWRAMRAAVERRTASGIPIAPGEALTPERALHLFTSPADLPGAPPRSVRVGAPADLCLLDRPWAQARNDLSSDRVVATWRDGRIVWPLS